jgi:8-amino-7-oxononanoate synthase
LSVLSTLLDATIFTNEQNNGCQSNSRPLVFFDRHNHSSLYHALRLAKGGPVECHRYAHNDFNHLESLLAEFATKWPKRPKFLVTESVFSMDGDILPMDDLLTILGKYPDLFVYLDEVHATGLMGPNGYGLSAALNKVSHAKKITMNF